MSCGETFLDLISYGVVFSIGAIVGGLAGSYVGIRFFYYYPAIALTCIVNGALLGGGVRIVFGLTRKQGTSTLREVHERMDRKEE